MDEVDQLIGLLRKAWEKYTQDTLNSLGDPDIDMGKVKYLHGRATGVSIAIDIAAQLKESLKDA